MDSLWLATAPSPSFEPLRGELHADVVVIGAGITGLTAALLLTERGRRVVVLEQKRVGQGETGHTTAHLTEAVDAGYRQIGRTFGKDAARRVAAAGRAAIDTIESISRRLAIDCRFRRVPGYAYTEKRRYVAELKNEAVSAKEAGIAARWTTEQIPLPFPVRGSVILENQAQFHPGEYLAGLARHLAGGDCRIFDRTSVTAVREGEPCVVETDGGRVTAPHVFMATNVPIDGFVSIHLKAAPYRTYAIAFDNAGEPFDGLFWDTADPYHYTRWQETAAGTFLIVGGEDHKVGQEEDTDGCFARLEQYVAERYPAARPRHRWSGQIIEPSDGLPYVGGSGPLQIATGYSGQGMTFGTVAAMIVADRITGAANEWAELFDAGRLPASTDAMRTAAAENTDFPLHLVRDRLASLDVEGTDPFDVKSGEGKIVLAGGRKVALHRDASGTLHAVSPVCTHMKCDVSWNPAERSWDCPCHGSRYTPDGEVLNGPAHEPLEKVDVGER